MSNKPSQPSKPASDVPEYRKCPRCYGGHKGVGSAYSTRGTRRYYKCSRCNFTWSAEVRRVTETVKIEHSDITLTER